MTILNKTKAITRFKVTDIPTADNVGLNATILAILNAGKIKEMDEGQDIVFGFTKILDPFNPEFDDMSFSKADLITFAIRIDKKTVPSKLLKQKIYFAEKKLLKDTGAEFLSRSQKANVKDVTYEKLLIDVHAVPTDYDVIWDIDKNVIYVLSVQKLAVETAQELIEETFQVKMTQMFPFTMAEKNFTEDELSPITPTSFV